MAEGERLEALAIIPARGGSKGLPGKNTLLLDGRPLIAYAVEAALWAETMDRVIVSTDSEAIAQAAVEAGAEVPFLRPASLAGDQADLSDVVYDLLDTLKEQEGYFPDIHATILPTFPFLGTKNIDAVVGLCRGGSISAFTVRPWGRRLDRLYVEREGALVPLLESEGRPEPEVKPEELLLGQAGVSAAYSLPKACRPQHDHAAFVAYVESLYAQGRAHTTAQCFVVHDPIALIDVDTEEDLCLAQMVLENGLWAPPERSISPITSSG